VYTYFSGLDERQRLCEINHKRYKSLFL